jgi:hypothetical protein
MDLIKVSIVSIALTLLACERAEVPDECLAVPEASKVEIVKVSVLNPDGMSKRSYQIDTRPRVEALVEAIRSNEGGQCKTFEQERPQDLSVAFSTYDSVPLILWIGPDWIGGVDTKKDSKGWLISRWRPMEPSERERLLELLREETPLGQ